MATERVVDNLNRALHQIMADDPRLFLLGEDVLDPYGGAFKASKGLSTRFPDRVLTTPISEGALVGFANGLALCGDKAIVEMMFADFVTLAFDQIVNFTAKSVSMYGRNVPMHVVIRCPTGGGRGYGPTHSQSLQKHFLGVPGLSVHELSPFHDCVALLRHLVGDGRPSILFEDKVLYTKRMYQGGVIDDLLAYEVTDGPAGTARAYFHGQGDRCDCLLIATGGLTQRVIDAARTLFIEEEVVSQILVPTQLFPVDFQFEHLAAQSQLICVVEDSSAGGTWGNEVAARLYERFWGRLHRRIELLSATDSVIPSAAHLERKVLPSADLIHRRVLEILHA